MTDEPIDVESTEVPPDETVVPLHEVIEAQNEALQQRLLQHGYPLAAISDMQTDAVVETLVDAIFPEGTENRNRFEVNAVIRLNALLKQAWGDVAQQRLLVPGPQTPV